MLAAIISLLQDQVQPQPPRHPTIKIDRGGGGARYPAYTIVDYISAAQTFPELRGEDSVARAKRRVEHITRELERIQRERQGNEQSMAYGFLWGAELQRRVYEAQEVERAALREVTALPAAPPAQAPLPGRMPRGTSSTGRGIALFLLGMGVSAWLLRRRDRSES